jgi:hypothetical protein
MGCRGSNKHWQMGSLRRYLLLAGALPSKLRLELILVARTCFCSSMLPVQMRSLTDKQAGRGAIVATQQLRADLQSKAT